MLNSCQIAKHNPSIILQTKLKLILVNLVKSWKGAVNLFSLVTHRGSHNFKKYGISTFFLKDCATQILIFLKLYYEIMSPLKKKKKKKKSYTMMIV
jgi:hypothetical protein